MYCVPRRVEIFKFFVFEKRKSDDPLRLNFHFTLIISPSRRVDFFRLFVFRLEYRRCETNEEDRTRESKFLISEAFKRILNSSLCI